MNGDPGLVEETVGDCLRAASRLLQRTPTGDSARLDAELLLCHVMGWTRTQLHIHLTDQVAAARRQEFWTLVAERRDGVPIAYLVGWKEFYARRFAVQPGVLVPRPETELLVEESLQLLRHSPGATRLLDLCCGSGCIAVTLALETQAERIVAADLDPIALGQCEENVRRFALEHRVEVVASDLFAGLEGEAFDLIVSNPPYVGTDLGPRPDPEVVSHEPATALFSGRDGTDHLKAIVERAPAHLIEGGSLIIECACFQAEKIEAWMDQRGYTQTRLWHDLSGYPRGVSGRWEGSAL